ncbi:MAG: hypothetical protein QME07_04100 [bacterium]|nr:hypothetical protein [bacterium]
MDILVVGSKLVSIEEEIRVLRSQLIGPIKKSKGFSSIEGIWKGKSNLSFDEIKETEIKLQERF